MFDLLVNTVPESTDSTEILPKSVRYDFHNADWVALRNALNEVDWHSILYDTPDVDVLWEKFTNTLWEVIDEHVPTIENVSNRKSSYKKSKYPCHIKKLLNQKLHPWRLFKRTSYEHHKAKFQDIKKCIAAINKFHSDKESKLINNGNLGSFFKYINFKTSYKSGVAPLKDLGGNLHNSDTDKAQLLNDHFATVFVQDDGRLPPFQ